MTKDPIVRVALLEAFDYGDDAVLVAMNPSGLEALTTALCDAQEQQFSRLTSDRRVHTFQSHFGAADIYLHGNCDDHVQWRLDSIIIQQLIEMLTGMKGKGLCHNYLDIKTPAHTLVLSVDEYLVPNAVVHTSPFGYF